MQETASLLDSGMQELARHTGTCRFWRGRRDNQEVEGPEEIARPIHEYLFQHE